MAFEIIDLGGNDVDLVERGPSSLEDEWWASRMIVNLLGCGKRFVRYKKLRPAKARLRKQRASDVLRELRSADRFGLRRLSAEDLASGLRPDRFTRAYPDWDLLDWWIQEWTRISVAGRWIEVPVLPDGRVKETLNSREIRCLMEWSQSFLEKVTPQLPGLIKEPGEYGVEVEVRTVEFILAINDPKYPFMRK